METVDQDCALYSLQFTYFGKPYRGSSTPAAVDDVTATSQSISVDLSTRTELIVGVVYSISVVAVNSIGESIPSNTVMYTRHGQLNHYSCSMLFNCSLHVICN